MNFSEVDFSILGVQVCAHRARRMRASKVSARPSPAHPQETKQEYHIDYPQRLVVSKNNFENFSITPTTRALS